MIAAHAQTAPDRAAVIKEERITVDIPTAVTILYGSIPAILAQKEAIKETFTKFPMHLIDNLETYASACLYAHTAWSFSLAPPAHVQELIALVTKRRGRVISVLETVVVHELVSADALDELSGPKGHKNIATDLIGTAEVLLNHWPVLEGKVPVTRSDLEQDRELGRKLLQAIGQRDQAPGTDGPLAIDRKRAYAVLKFAFDEARAAIVYVRRHVGDADRIIPTIYNGGPRKTKDEEADEAAAAPVTGVVPALPANGAAVAARSTLPVGHPDSEPLASE
jgi:hypothetical protein